MDTWTIISTLITGAIFGIALMCGVVYLAIRSYDKETAARRERREAHRRQRVGENPFTQSDHH